MTNSPRTLAPAGNYEIGRHKAAQYAANTVGAIAGIAGLAALIFMTAPKGFAPAAVQISGQPSLPISVVSQDTIDAAIIRKGVLTQTVTALDAMEVLGADRQEADAALASLRSKDFIGKQGIPSGVAITVHLEPGEASDEGRSLRALTFRPEAGRSLIAKRLPDGTYFGAELQSKLIPSHRRVEGVIAKTLSEDLARAGAPKAQAAQFQSVFAYNSKVPRALSTGDRFELVYEVWEDERGQKIESGDVVYAALEGKAIDRDFYRYTPSDNGITDYFDASGNSAERFLMRKPVRGAPVTSRFGRRKHPIKGHVHIHKGVDLKAPMSTRIYAAGDGVVEKVGRNGGYGRYVQIRHANGYKTAYAHMSGYSRKLYPGSTVKQGDLVGFVGSTGHSTGPHLHYEVLLNGRHVDPMALQLPTGRKLAAKPAVQTEFDTHRQEIDAVRRVLRIDRQFAEAGSNASVSASAARGALQP